MRGFRGEMLAASSGQRIKLRLAVVIGGPPFGRNPAALLEADERRVNGSLVEQDLIAADLLDAAGNAVAVLRAHNSQRLQDHDVKGSLQEVEFILGHGHSMPQSMWRCHRNLRQDTVESGAIEWIIASGSSEIPASSVVSR